MSKCPHGNDPATCDADPQDRCGPCGSGYVTPAAPTGDLITHELNRRMRCIVDGQPVHVQHLTRAQRRAMKRAQDKREARGA